MKLKNFVMVLVLMFSVNLFADVTFDLKDSKGNKVTIEGTSKGLNFPTSAGKVVLLNFFGKQCPPCLLEIPSLVSVKDKFKNSFDLIAVQVQEPLGKELDSFITEKKINYTVLDGEQTYELVEFVMAKTDWKGMVPFMLLFDKNGKFIKPYVGMASKEEIMSDIESLL